MKKLILYLFLFPMFTHASNAKNDSTLLHPVFDRLYACIEHQTGQFKELGDALGTDCYIIKMIEEDGRKWTRSYKENGHNNEDWFGWHQNVLSPIDGVIQKININPQTNKPGILGSGLATYIIIQRKDGLNVILAHITSIQVKVGEKVKAGQVIALVGNNGQSYHPHVHIGAWRKKEPLQIRFDQSKIINR